MVIFATDSVACDSFVPESAARACHFAQLPIAGFLDEGRASIIRTLGAPTKVTQVERANAYSMGQVDLEEWLEFPSSKLSLLLLAGDPKRAFPIVLTTSDANLTFRYGIRIGTPSQRIVELLGKPYEIDSRGRWKYGGESDEVLLIIRNEKLLTVVWLPYQG